MASEREERHEERRDGTESSGGPRLRPVPVTPLGRAVDRAEDRAAGRDRRAREGGEAPRAREPRPEPAGHEEHRRGNWLRDVILGGQDGLVNILGIILGVIAGGGSTTVLIATGIAAAITESISMGAVGYTSSASERDYYRAERERETEEIDNLPDVERGEIRDIYAAKGFEGELLDRVVDTITANREEWVDTMMSEELHLQPVEDGDILRSAVLITVATLIGHVVPLVPFFLLARTEALVAALVLSALVLFGVGAYSAATLVGDWRAQGLRMVAIGLGAAFVGFAVSSLFHVNGGG